jgi:hypothetical protein
MDQALHDEVSEMVIVERVCARHELAVPPVIAGLVPAEKQDYSPAGVERI